MIKEEIVDFMKTHEGVYSEDDIDFESNYVYGVVDGYTYAEKNFESRTCENCEWYQKEKRLADL